MRLGTCGSLQPNKINQGDLLITTGAGRQDGVTQFLVPEGFPAVSDLDVAIRLRDTAKRNNHPHPDFLGLSPTQMANWLYAPFDELDWVIICTPEDLSSSPVMRYLTLILCLLYTSPSPRDLSTSRMPSSA